ncbi:MAG: peptide ligase PGM1-related protein [Polyangiaceae bacterium]
MKDKPADVPDIPRSPKVPTLPPRRSRHSSLLPPAPASEEHEHHQFTLLQRTLVDRWLALHQIESEPRDVVVVPSLSLDGFQLSAIPGITHYEERMLFTMGLLRNPRARLVYVTSQPLHPAMLDYYLALIGGIPTAHARSRLTIMSCYDTSPRPLTEKILERPRLMRRIRDSIDPDRAHLTVFTVSDRERSLAVRLGIPLYGVDPSLLHLGTKTGSRRVFRAAGVPMAPGAEDLHSEGEVAEAIANLWEEDPKLQRFVVKLNQGFSGEGNAILPVGDELLAAAPGKAGHAARVDAVLAALPQLRFMGPTETWPRFRDALGELGGVVEAFLEGSDKRSPSVQLRINPRGDLQAMSTHDQLLGGLDGQLYLGCRFPADDAYRRQIQKDALAVGEVLRDRGCVGRVAVDFVTVKAPAGDWRHYAIEINLRMTGTTHPIMTLKLLNDGVYDEESGLYITRRGEPRFYVSTDNLMKPHYRGLLPDDVLDIAAVQDVHYQPWNETGVVFHLLGAVSQFGKIGLTAIGSSPEQAEQYYDAAEQALDQGTLGTRSPGTIPPRAPGA